MTTLSRRTVLQLAASVPASAWLQRMNALNASAFTRAPWKAVASDGSAAPASVQLTRTWNAERCRFVLRNNGSIPVALKEVVLFEVTHALPRETPVYGEGFQMLSQTGGTLNSPTDLGNYTDRDHYKLSQPPDASVVYNLVTLASLNVHQVLAFTSCRRFSGRFYMRPEAIDVVLDLEGLSLGPNESWPLEEFVFHSGADREALLESVASRLAAQSDAAGQRTIDKSFIVSGPRDFAVPPSGWCSWYCFGPKVTARQVLDNLDVIARDIPGLRYIQIDDGYQPAMGDWLETGSAFGGEVQMVLRQIRDRGFEPAIWVAPFIAEASSNVFRQHPDWFVKDDAGKPLRADRVTFGGWRRGPWYALDGTHPDAQSHLERVFRTMRDEWGCTYFKLDANFWGAIHGGRFHDPRASRVEGYRRGMAAVLKGTRDAFVLGCNHPLWPSIGLIHGSRSSHDIRRDWKRIRDTARQNLSRNWQNGRLWWNDADAIVLTGDLSDDEFRFHATVIFASGGMILSGDDLTTIPPQRLAMLKKLQPPTGRAARFTDASLRVGVVRLQDRQAICLLNWDDGPQTVGFSLARSSRVRELWTDEDLGLRSGENTLTLSPRSGRVLLCDPT
jgi:alpha-galactosidase